MIEPHLRPTATIAADVLVPADPGLALTLAQELLARPRMANHHHGLWGYSGPLAEGDGELTIQATGIGAASAAAVVAELAGHGARRLIRVGLCATLDRGTAPEDPAIVAAAIAGDGPSRTLAGKSRLGPDPGLLDALRAAGGDLPDIVVAGVDLAYDPEPERRRKAALEAGAGAIDLETAAVLASAAHQGIAAAAVLVVADPERKRNNGEPLEPRLVAAGKLAARALARRQAAVQTAATEPAR